MRALGLGLGLGRRFIAQDAGSGALVDAAQLLAGTGAMFAPDQEAGFKVWLDPARGVTGSGATLAWSDQGGNAAAFAATGSGVAPGAGINGRPSLDFTGAAYLASASNLSVALTAAAWSAVVVYNYSGAYAFPGAGLEYRSPAVIGANLSSYWGISVDTTHLSPYQFTAGFTYVADLTATTTSANYYAVIKYDGVNIYTSLNGGAFDAGTAAGNINSLAHPMQVGPGFNNSGIPIFIGSMGDICLFDGTLSDAAVARINAGLKGKYGF